MGSFNLLLFHLYLHAEPESSGFSWSDPRGKAYFGITPSA